MHRKREGRAARSKYTVSLRGFIYCLFTLTTLSVEKRRGGMYMLLGAGCLPCPYKESERKREGEETEEEDWEMGKGEGDERGMTGRWGRKREKEKT